MDNLVRTDFATHFAAAVAAHRGSAFLEGDTLNALTMHTDGRISVTWAPFDHIFTDARLVVVGITPGRQQAENALAAFKQAIAAGASPAEASRRAKYVGAFSGPIRNNLAAMLDRIGVQSLLGVRSGADLFSPGPELVHFTSALRHPVLVNGKDYNGTPDMLGTPALRQQIETHLAEEARALPSALWLPLGPKPVPAVRHLATRGLIDPERILEGLPHPSGANGERVAYFLGRKERAELSTKTRPEPLDEARERLTAQITRLRLAA
ncbi:hypothetical protein [Neoroseomonas rubea]|uniref:hypothetical protein n=1 Tax=Neoroseomonas rubea TaxID=2748666 RepID=UPI0018DF39B6|nr:hypothetical protein [Roseomonas rubea]